MSSDCHNLFLTEMEKKRLEKALSDIPEIVSPEMESISSASFRSRMFSITEYRHQYYPFEYEPISVMLPGETQLNADNMIKELMELYRSNPNGFSQCCQEKGVDLDDMCFMGGELGVGAIGYSKLNETIEAVFQAIESNCVIKSRLARDEFDEDMEEAFHQEELERLLAMSAHWDGYKIDERDDPPLFSDKINSHGEPLTREERELLMNYLNGPTLSLWQYVYNIELTPSDSVWSVLSKLNTLTPDSFDKFTEKNIPDTELFAQILFQSIKLHNRKCQTQMMLINERITEEEYLFKENEEHKEEMRKRQLAGGEA